MAPHECQVILFDLGGVLVDVDSVACVATHARETAVPGRDGAVLAHCLKPTRAAFEHVLADIGCAPAYVVFLDDNQLNVDAARAVGLQAYRAVGIAEVRTVLRSLGLLGTS